MNTIDFAIEFLSTRKDKKAANINIYITLENGTEEEFYIDAGEIRKSITAKRLPHKRGVAL